MLAARCCLRGQLRRRLASSSKAVGSDDERFARRAERALGCRLDAALGCLRRLPAPKLPASALADDCRPATELLAELEASEPGLVDELLAERLALTSTPFSPFVPRRLGAEQLLFLSNFRQPLRRLAALQLLQELSAELLADDSLLLPHAAEAEAEAEAAGVQRPTEAELLAWSLQSLALLAASGDWQQQQQVLALDFGDAQPHCMWQLLARQLLLCLQANYASPQPYRLLLCGLRQSCVLHDYFRSEAGFRLDELPLDTKPGLAELADTVGRDKLLYLSAFSPNRLQRLDSRQSLVMGVSCTLYEPGRRSVARAERLGLRHAALPLAARCGIVSGLQDVPISVLLRVLLRLRLESSSWQLAAGELPPRLVQLRSRPSVRFMARYAISREAVRHMLLPDDAQCHDENKSAAGTAAPAASPSMREAAQQQQP